MNRLQLGLALALLVLLALVALTAGERTAARPFDPDSTAPDGLRVLWLWLEAMDYVVVRNSGANFVIPDDSVAMFVYPGEQTYSRAPAVQLADWVADGGTLVLVGPSVWDEELITYFRIAPGEPVAGLVNRATQRQPLIPDLAEAIQIGGGGESLDLSMAPTAIPILTTSDDKVTLALQPLGKGRIWHLSLQHSLVNEQLRDPAQAAIVPALLRHLPAGSRIGFDTYHLFGSGNLEEPEVGTLQDWLYQTSPGWALLFGLAVTLLFLLLQGRRLGPPLPDDEVVRRREAAEYVRAMANLMQRSRQHAMIAQHHHQRLKRGLGRTLNISPDQDDEQFVAALLQVDHTLSTHEKQLAITLLQQLQGDVPEPTLTRAVSQIDGLLKGQRGREVA